MKIYTQTGDEGKTSLLSGERVPKNNRRIQAYGEIDELNSLIGALIAALAEEMDLGGELQQIQSDLMQAGAWLSATPISKAVEGLKPFGAEHTRRLEVRIDAMDRQLPALRSFILPGGTAAAAWSHLARTVCRRAERRIVEVIEVERAEETGASGLQLILMFINRLSDYFFVLARFINQQAGTVETSWSG